MICLDIRRRILTDPLSVDHSTQMHLWSCQACGKSFIQASFFEKRLAAALDVIPTRPMEVELNIPPTANLAPPASRRAVVLGGLAALAVAGTAIGLTFDVLFPSLPSQLTPYLKSNTLANVDPVSPALLRNVLHHAGASLVDPDIPVTYAANCTIKGRIAAHLVVRMPDGLVSVFLMPEFPIEDIEYHQEGPWTVRIEPLSHGSIAFFGLKPDGVDAASGAVRKAVSFN